MKPKIAVSLTPRTIDSTSAMMRKADLLGADLAEVRLDYLNATHKIHKIVQNCRMPLIATFRSAKNGGARSSTQEERVRILKKAAEAGFHYVDVEVEMSDLNSLIDTLSGTGAKTITSYHNFTGTPPDIVLRKRLQQCQNSGATISKIVTTARKLEDNLRLLDLIAKTNKKSKIVSFAMGKNGLSSRILSPIYGAAFTFASLNERTLAAPGQISISRMRRIYDELRYT